MGASAFLGREDATCQNGRHAFFAPASRRLGKGAQGAGGDAQGVMEAACPATATGLFLMREGGVGQHACTECTPQVKPEAPAAVEPTPQAQPVKVSVILEPEAEK